MTFSSQPVCLSLAGLDPSGGAGIIADINTFRALGCFGTAAVTSITFQSTTRVFGAEHLSAESLRHQVEPLFDDFSIAALKTGMLPTGDIIAEAAWLITEHQIPNLVVDPVMRSSSGYDLIDETAVRQMIERLIPLSVVVTPNIPEAERITGSKIYSEVDISRAARSIQSMGAANVLIKGGHFEESIRRGIATDVLFEGDDVHTFESVFVDTPGVRGTGCVLSAAIAANLALGMTLVASVEKSKAFVADGIRNASQIGRGGRNVPR